MIRALSVYRWCRLWDAARFQAVVVGLDGLMAKKVNAPFVVVTCSIKCEQAINGVRFYKTNIMGVVGHYVSTVKDAIATSNRPNNNVTQV